MFRFLLLFAALLGISPAFAQRVSQSAGVTPQPADATRIAAVVNDNIITTNDLVQRMRLATLSSGLPDTAEVRAHLLPQILRSIIDEQLQTQEAKRLDLSVSSEEIDQALDRVAKENHIQGDMREFVAAHGGSPEALVDQVRASLLWSKVVQRELRPKVEVGDDDIDAVIERVRANAGKEEYLVSEIFLAVDNPKDDEQVKQVAGNLVDQIRKGASFAAVARQFSQGTGASQGGDLGWIEQGQLAPELNKALTQATPGEISAPIRSANGYHILGLREKRMVALGDPSKASLNLMQAFRPYGSADKDAVMREANRLRGVVKNCADLAPALAAGFPGWKAQKLGDMTMGKAPAWMLDKVSGVPAGGATAPLATDKGAALLFVCSKNDGGDVDRAAIMRSIGGEKIELQARRLLRDLRRSAYLDIRLGQDS